MRRGVGVLVLAYFALVSCGLLTGHSDVKVYATDEDTTSWLDYFVTRVYALPSGVADVKITISGVEMSKDGVDWVTVGSSSVTFSLKDLDSSGARVELASNNYVPTGTYEWIRLKIDSIEIKEENSDTYEQAVSDLTITIHVSVKVSGWGGNEIVINFNSESSISASGTGWSFDPAQLKAYNI